MNAASSQMIPLFPSDHRREEDQDQKAQEGHHRAQSEVKCSQASNS